MIERHILVVDDDPDLLETLRALLERDEATRVHAVETAQEARDLLASGQEFHLIISDLRLGHESGVEFLRELTRTRPHTPRMVLTGYGHEGLKGTGIRRGDAESIFEKDRLLLDRNAFLDAVDRLSGESTS